MGDFQTIRFQVSDGVATITLNQADRLNPLDAQTISEIFAALDTTLASKSRVLVFRGAGRAFSSGAGLKDANGDPALSGDLGQVLEDFFNPLLERLCALPIPIVSVVQGVAAGAGCSLALASDFVIASSKAYFLMAFVNIGLVPDMGATWLLPRLIGVARATEMMMLGGKIAAEQAAAWGLIHRAVPPEDLEEAASDLITRLGRGPTVAYGMLRTTLRAGLHAPLAEILAMERRNQRTAGQTSDSAEGIQAFLDKRPAAFIGA